MATGITLHTVLACMVDARHATVPMMAAGVLATQYHSDGTARVYFSVITHDYL